MVAIRNAQKKREEKEQVFFGLSRQGAVRNVTSQQAAQQQQHAKESLWETIFGSSKRDKAADAVQRAEEKSISRIMEEVGCTRAKAQKHLRSKGVRPSKF